MRKKTEPTEKKPLEKQITALLNKRMRCLRNKVDKTADAIQEAIYFYLNDGFDDLSVDFIIETITKLGAAPQLVYDDNGQFAVSDTGMAPVVYDDEKLTGIMTSIIDKDSWFPTIRQALKYYLVTE